MKIFLIIVGVLASLYFIVQLTTMSDMKRFKVVKNEVSGLFTLYGKNVFGIWSPLYNLCERVSGEFIVKFPGSNRTDCYYIKQTYKNQEEAMETMNKIINSIRLANQSHLELEEESRKDHNKTVKEFRV